MSHQLCPKDLLTKIFFRPSNLVILDCGMAIQDRKSIYDMMDAQRVKNKLSIAYKHPKPEIWFMQRSLLLGVLG